MGLVGNAHQTTPDAFVTKTQAIDYASLSAILRGFSSRLVPGRYSPYGSRRGFPCFNWWNTGEDSGLPRRRHVHW